MPITVERLVAEVEANPAGAIAGLTALDGAMDVAARDRTAVIDIRTDRSMDALGSLIHATGSVDNAFRSMMPSLGSVAGGMGGIGDGGKNAAGGLGDAAGASRGFGSSLVGLIPSLIGGAFQFGAIYTAVAALPGAFAAAGAAAGALVASLAPLLGLLGAIPVGIGALGGGLLATVAGLSGIREGLTASNNLMKNADQTTQSLARRQRELASAYRSLREAQQGVVRAQKELKDAQAALVRAPAEAAEALADQRRAVRQAVLSEEQAVLRLKQAQENLANAQNKTAKSGYTLSRQIDYFTGKTYEVATASDAAVEGAQDEAGARLAVKQAELDLADARDRSSDEQKRLNEMERKGIKGSDVMVSARRRLQDAQYGVARAHDNVAAAQDRIKESQAALKKQQDGTNASMRAYNQAMANLSPTGRRFVEFLKQEFIPAWKEVKFAAQDALLPGIQDGLEAVMGRMGMIKGRVSDFAQTVGDSFADFMEFWARPKRADQLNEMFKGLNDVLGDTLKLARPTSRVLVSITESAKPMVDIIQKGVLNSLDRLADWMESDKGKKETRKFFKDAAYFGGLWMDVLKGVGGTLKGIARGGRPLAVTLLKDLAGYFGDLSDRINSPEGQRNLKKWFADQLPALREFGNLIRDIGDLLFNSTKGGTDSAFYTTLHSIRMDLLPQIKDMLENMDAGDFGSDFVKGIGDFTDAIVKFQNSDTMKVIDGIATAIVHVGDAIKYVNGQGADKKGKQSWWEKFLFGDASDKKQLAEGQKSMGEAGQGFLDWWDKYINGDEGLGGKLRSWGPWFTEKWDETWKTMKTNGVAWWKDLKGQWHDFIAYFKGEAKDSPKWPTFKGMFDGIKDAFLSVWEWIRDKWNNLEIGWDAKKVAGKTVIPAFQWSPSPLAKMRQFGGDVKKGEPYIVGEKRPELFVPSSGGRIMPTVSRSAMESNGKGITDAQLESVLSRVLENAKAPVTLNNTFNEKVDPMHVGAELAWRLA